MEEDEESLGLEGLQLFKASEVLSEFLDDSFNVQSYTTNVIQNTNITHRLAELDDGICILDKELQTQIAKRHGDLLAQATGIESLEGVLTMMQSRIVSIQSAVDRIRSKVGEPYKKIQARTTQLGRLQSTCDILRRMIRLQRISKRLKTQLQGGLKEITKSAQSLRELEHLSQGIDLHGIEVFDENQIFFHRAKEEVHMQADRLLDQGLRSQNQTHTATALQAFYNLGCLQTPVDKVEKDTVKHIKSCIKNALDNSTAMISQSGVNTSATNKGPGKISGFHQPGASVMFRNNLWNGLEILIDQISTSFLQLFHLQRVLLKKRDPVSHVIFADEITKNTDKNFIQTAWVETCENLQSHLNDSGVLKSTLESEYPKLLRLFLELWNKMKPHEHLIKTNEKKLTSSFAENHEKIENKKPEFDARRILMTSLSRLETAFLQKSVSRLFDPINLLFPSGGRTPPSSGELETVLKTINNELNISTVDTSLTISVARNIGKTIQLFVAKCEQLLATQGDASQVIGPPTSAQVKNVQIVNALTTLQTGVNKIMVSLPDDLPQQANMIIQNSCDHIATLMMNSVQPLIDSAADSAEAIILTMHDEDFSSNKSDEKVISSLYMRELRDFLSRVVKDHFSSFISKDFVMIVLLPLGHRCIKLFVRHASLVRPLGEVGKLKLSADFTQLEQTLSPLCSRLTDFGSDYRLLRSFKSLLFQSDEAIAQSTTLGEVISYSLAIQTLISRSHKQLRSPHQVMEWSVAKYSRWMDDHWSEHERLNMLRGAIENYVNCIRSKQENSFVSTYPVLLKLLQKGIEMSSQ